MGERGIGEKNDKGRGKEGDRGKGGGEGAGKTLGAPIRDLSNHQLKSTLMVPVGEKANECMRHVNCEYI